MEVLIFSSFSNSFQRFFAEVFSVPGAVVVGNYSSVRPEFWLDGLIPSTEYQIRVFAANDHGRSNAATLLSPVMPHVGKLTESGEQNFIHWSLLTRSCNALIHWGVYKIRFAECVSELTKFCWWTGHPFESLSSSALTLSVLAATATLLCLLLIAILLTVVRLRKNSDSLEDDKSTCFTIDVHFGNLETLLSRQMENQSGWGTHIFCSSNLFFQKQRIRHQLKSSTTSNSEILKQVRFHFASLLLIERFFF